jgi:hypothetical protein
MEVGRGWDFECVFADKWRNASVNTVDEHAQARFEDLNERFCCSMHGASSEQSLVCAACKS